MMCIPTQSIQIYMYIYIYQIGNGAIQRGFGQPRTLILLLANVARQRQARKCRWWKWWTSRVDYALKCVLFPAAKGLLATLTLSPFDADIIGMVSQACNPLLWYYMMLRMSFSPFCSIRKTYMPSYTKCRVCAISYQRYNFLLDLSSFWIKLAVCVNWYISKQQKI
jgi:hypothetical protein